MGDEVRTEENFFRWTITINSFTGRSLSSQIATLTHFADNPAQWLESSTPSTPLQRDVHTRVQLGFVRRDLMKHTSCQRRGSGNFDQSGMPRRTTPLLRIQKIAPGSAV